MIFPRRHHCEAIHDILLLCKRIERDMKKRPFLSKLEPIFYLIGSVAEGTRQHAGSEGDITVKFDGLQAFVVGEDATMLTVVDELDAELLCNFLKEENTFDYPAFLHFFLREIDDVLINLSKKNEIPSTFKIDFQKHQTRPKSSVATHWQTFFTMCLWIEL